MFELPFSYKELRLGENMSKNKVNRFISVVN